MTPSRHTGTSCNSVNNDCDCPRVQLKAEVSRQLRGPASSFSQNGCFWELSDVAMFSMFGESCVFVGERIAPQCPTNSSLTCGSRLAAHLEEARLLYTASTSCRLQSTSFPSSPPGETTMCHFAQFLSRNYPKKYFKKMFPRYERPLNASL